MRRLLAFALLFASIGLACGDSGGEGSDAGALDSGADPVPCPEISSPRMSGNMTINGNAYTFDCDLSVAEREDIIFLETPNITSGAIRCQRPDDPRYTVALDIKSEPFARTYNDDTVVEVSALIREGISLNGPTAMNTSFHQVIVECWDKANLRINGSFEASFSQEGSDNFNGYGEISGSFSANLMQ